MPNWIETPTLNFGEKKTTKSYINMIGNQTTIPSHCDGEVVIATSWLAGHEIQLKNATKSQEKR